MSFCGEVLADPPFLKFPEFGLGSYLRLAVEQYKSLLAFKPVPHLPHSLMLVWKQMYFYLHLQEETFTKQP